MPSPNLALTTCYFRQPPPRANPGNYTTIFFALDFYSIYLPENCTTSTGIDPFIECISCLGRTIALQCDSAHLLPCFTTCTLWEPPYPPSTYDMLDVRAQSSYASCLSTGDISYVIECSKWSGPFIGTISPDVPIGLVVQTVQNPIGPSGLIV